MIMMHKHTSMAGWPSALREECMRRKKAGEGRGRPKSRLQ